MDLLLDTHAFLWFYQNDPQLSPKAKSLIEDPANTVFLSVASCWEMAVKYKIGKLTLAEEFAVLIPREIKNNGFELLDITYAHAEGTIALELHHKDPFDRMLIAQAIIEGMPLVSNEVLFDSYAGLDRRW